MRIQFRFALLMFLAICSAASIAATSGTIKVYKWVDDKGVTHYDQTPPLATPKEVIKYNKTASSEAPTAAENSSAKSVTKKETSAATSSRAIIKDKENCEIGKKNLSTLNGYARIKVVDDKGEYRYLTEDEKEQRITEANQLIQDNCE